MSLIKRQKLVQPVLMAVESTPSAAPTNAKPTRKELKTASYWPEVVITPDAQARLKNLEIMHFGVNQAVQQTLSSILELHRAGRLKGTGFEETSVMPCDDVPHDIRVVYQYSPNRLVLVDVRRPDQPSLFGV